MRTIFWISSALVLYVYAGYPLLLAVWARLARRPATRPAIDAVTTWPSISIVLAARNEAGRLPARLANLLTIPYHGPREVIVVSDGSTDGTADVVAAFGDAVRLVNVPAGGKPAALNAGVAAARGDVLVFADARQRFSEDTLLQLAANFADPQVGGVTGELLLDAEQAHRGDTGDHRGDTGDHRGNTGDHRRHTGDHRGNTGDHRGNTEEHWGHTEEHWGHTEEHWGHTEDAQGETTASTVGDGVGLYWQYEKWLRRNESLIWSTVGATGAIYALRRSLWRPLPPETLLDDVLAPMRAVLDGWRIVFEERARAFDRASADAEAEARRKIRTLAGNYQILAQEPRLLIPFVNPVWLQYVSHKVGRLLVPWALIASFGASAALMFEGWIYAGAFAGQAAFYALAAYGGWSEQRARRAERLPDALREATR